MKPTKVKYDVMKNILNYEKKHTFQKWCCDWYILPNDCEGYDAFCKIKLIYYLLLVIPIHLLLFISLIYDGGLKLFKFVPREIEHWHFFKYDTVTEIIRELVYFK